MLYPPGLIHHEDSPTCDGRLGVLVSGEILIFEFSASGTCCAVLLWMLAVLAFAACAICSSFILSKPLEAQCQGRQQHQIQQG